jgi:hypothetical protein
LAAKPDLALAVAAAGRFKAGLVLVFASPVSELALRSLFSHSSFCSSSDSSSCVLFPFAFTVFAPLFGTFFVLGFLAAAVSASDEDPASQNLAGTPGWINKDHWHIYNNLFFLQASAGIYKNLFFFQAWQVEWMTSGFWWHMTMNWMMTIGFTTLSHPGIWIALVLISDHMEKCCFKLAQDAKNPKCSPNLGMGQN